MVKVLKYIMIGVAVITITAFILLKWVFWEPSDIKRSSFLYYLKVPEYAKNFPIWDAVNTPTYDIRHTDGERKSATIIYYVSSLSRNELWKMANKLTSKCYQLTGEESICKKEVDIGQYIEIYFVKQVGTTYFDTTVYFIGF